MLTYQESKLIDKLTPLSHSKRVLFATSCAARLLPLYKKLSIETGVGNYLLLESAMSDLWIWVSGKRKDVPYYEALIGRVMDLMPEEDATKPKSIPYMDDCAASFCYALRAIVSNDCRNAAWAARRVYEAIDYYVINARSIDINAVNAERSVLEDGLIQAELARQARDISMIIQCDDVGTLATEIATQSSLESIEIARVIK